MKIRVLFIERLSGGSPSLERVFRRIAEHLPTEEFDTAFQAVPYGDGAINVLRNIVTFRPAPADIYHIAGHVTYIATRLSGKRTVLTMPDLILLHIRTGLRRWLLKKLYIDWPIQRASRVTTISEFTKGEMEKYSAVARPDVLVIPCPLTEGSDAGPARRLFDHRRPTILHIGSAPNKNLPALVAAVDGSNWRLRIVGRPDREIQERLDSAAIRYEWLSGLDENQMTGEYRLCDIVSFCTTYEGFGLPIIEAQAIGKPVITSDLEPHRSVAGAGALFVDPNDPGAIRAAIERLIAEPELRMRLINAGLRNIERFEAPRIAARYAALYREMMTAGSKDR